MFVGEDRELCTITGSWGSQGLSLVWLLLEMSCSATCSSLPLWQQQHSTSTGPAEKTAGKHRPRGKPLRSHRVGSTAGMLARCRRGHTKHISAMAALPAPVAASEQRICPMGGASGSAAARQANMAKAASCPFGGLRGVEPILARAASSPAHCLRSHSLELAGSEAGSPAGSFADLSLLDHESLGTGCCWHGWCLFWQQASLWLRSAGKVR